VATAPTSWCSTTATTNCARNWPRRSSTANSTSASLLDEIVEQSRVAKSDAEHARAKDIIGELVKEVLDGTVVVSDNLSATLDARVADLDRLISAQLSAVMHAPEFQKLESTWRGMSYLVKETQTGTMIKIKALNATKRDLVRDFKTAIDFDQSALFKKVYEEEFGTFGGAPFGALIGDYEITRQPEDISISSNRCRTSPRPRTHRSSPRPRRSCSGWSRSPTWASRVTWPRCSTRSNTPSGSRSASPRIRVMSA
jgi:predicted component of type VI protein secretion system